MFGDTKKIGLTGAIEISDHLMKIKQTSEMLHSPSLLSGVILGLLFINLPPQPSQRIHQRSNRDNHSFYASEEVLARNATDPSWQFNWIWGFVRLGK